MGEGRRWQEPGNGGGGEAGSAPTPSLLAPQTPKYMKLNQSQDLGWEGAPYRSEGPKKELPLGPLRNMQIKINQQRQPAWLKEVSLSLCPSSAPGMLPEGAELMFQVFLKKLYKAHKFSSSLIPFNQVALHSYFLSSSFLAPLLALWSL